MLAATLKALTWGTVAMAIVSAFLLALDGDGDGLRYTERTEERSGHGTGAATQHSAAMPTPLPSPARSSRSTPLARPDSGADRYR